MNDNEGPAGFIIGVIITLAIIILLFAKSAPLINHPKDAFVVIKIKVDKTYPGFAKYYGDGHNRNFAGQKPILLPVGMFNIGDTIEIK